MADTVVAALLGQVLAAFASAWCRQDYDAACRLGDIASYLITLPVSLSE